MQLTILRWLLASAQHPTLSALFAPFKGAWMLPATALGGRLFPVLGRGYAGDEGELSKIHTLGNPVTRQPRAARRRPHRRRLHRRSTEKMATPDLVDGDGSHPLLPAKAGPPAGEVVCGQGVLLTHNTLKLIHIVLYDGVCPPMLYCDQLILSLVLPHYSSVSFPQVPCLKRLCISRVANPRW
jgi:hypothetical protein